MAFIAGVDVGNNTTEVAVAEFTADRELRVLASAIVMTTGIKGTAGNAVGIVDALDEALRPLGLTYADLSAVLLNEAAPVIGDVAMETITETVITESAMIGHNPSTPGGQGLALGTTVRLEDLEAASGDEVCIAIVPGGVDFEEAARLLNRALSKGVPIAGAIVQKDDAVLIHNRLVRPMPIVDEVKEIGRVPVGMIAAIEVAGPGRSIEKLCNPYDIATVFCLNPEETRHVVPIARALMGTRSAVVIKTPRGDIQTRRIPAGRLKLIGRQRNAEVRVEEGAEAIMAQVRKVAPLVEIAAEPGTHVGGMFEHVRKVMATLTHQPVSTVRVQDILAVDTFKPQRVIGGLAGELSLGNAVGLAAMVEAHRLPMQLLAERLQEKIHVDAVVGGVEAEMAIRGALTTPGTEPPLAILDLGGGSTDASVINESGEIRSIHLAGAGDMVTLLIDTELGLEDRGIAEKIKHFPLAKVETLFHMRHEDGSVQFFHQPLHPRLFGRVVVVTDEGLLPVETREPLGKIAAVRQQAKQKVFVRNAVRALEQVAPYGNIRLLSFVVLVGGSALDFEIPRMITDALMEYGVVTGRANIRGVEGPRNAVATGLVLAYAERENGVFRTACPLGQ
ncbi:MAG: diol dehydratase reactivase subunit alpha [Deltaproteobacteria bacterium]|nr:diol dehydratase reactivase subunit alpha [Deltaproteobacteria bacterium]